MEEEERSSFWFWVVPPLAVAVAVGAWHFGLLDRFLRPSSPSPAEAHSAPGSVSPLISSGGPVASSEGSGAPSSEPPPSPTGDASPPGPFADSETAERLLPGLVGALSSHPRIALWLRNDRLLTRFVRAVDCISVGESPRIPLDFAAPGTPYSAMRTGQGLVPAPADFSRYDILAEAIASLDSAGSVELYRRLEPVCERLYRTELGYSQRTFRQALDKALSALLATPVPEGRIGLVRSGSVYRYEDPTLEGLNDAQKHLLRMGPVNMRKIQEKLRQFAVVLRQPAGPGSGARE